MRKITILSIMVFFSFSLMAQHVVTNKVKEVRMASKEDIANAVKYYNSKSTLDFGTPIYTEDFAGGMPAGWSATVATGDPSWLWKWTLTGPNGETTSSIVPLNSTTAANGWMIYDSDSIGNGVYDVSLVSKSYDFSAQASVQVVFQEYYRKWADATYVGVSNDGGTTWTDIQVHADFESKDMTTNPGTLAVNITPYAAGAEDVKIRFRMTGDWDYHWQIDDLKFFEVPTNDIQIQKIYVDYFYADGGAYNLIPRNQPIGGVYGAKIYNFGSDAQTNVTLNVKVNNGTTDVYDQSTTPIASQASLASDSVTIDSTTPFELDGTGNATSYTINYSISATAADQDLSNNTTSLNVQTTNGVYGRDNGVRGGRVSPQIWVDGGNDGDIIAVGYDITAASVAEGVYIFIDASTGVGGTTIVPFLALSDGSGSYNDVVTVDPIDITAEMLGKWNYIPFTTATSVEIGRYIVGVSITFGTGDVYIGEDVTTPQRNNTTIWKFNGGEYTAITNYVNRTPMIRLQLQDALSGIQNVNNKNEASVYPNPSNGLLNIENAEKSLVSIYNMIGEKVAEMNCNSNLSTFNVSTLSEGTYIVKIQNSNNITTTKINIIK